jgi:putative glutathione S-transferase
MEGNGFEWYVFVYENELIVVKFRHLSPHASLIFHSIICSTEPGSKFLPENGRYRLYVSRACPDSHRVLLARTLKGLEDVVAVSYVQPCPQDRLERNWMIMSPASAVETMDDSFASPKSNSSNHGDFHSVREIYQSQGDVVSNSVPLLYDSSLNCIVNNNAEQISEMFDSRFQLSQNPRVNLFPKKEVDSTTTTQQQQFQQVQEWLYPLLQLTPSHLPPYHYNVSSRQLNCALDRASTILQRQRYLTSRTSMTDADVRLFVALIRYDAVYARYLERAPKLLQNPCLMDFCRDIFQQPGVAKTVRMDEIQTHFFGQSPPIGTDHSRRLLESLKMPHKRNLF